VLKTYVAPTSQALFSHFGIFSDIELHARYEVRLERYVKALGIELHTLLDLLRTQVVPAAIRYQNELATLLATPALQGWATAIAPEKLPQQALLDTLQTHLEGLWKGIQRAQALWSEVSSLPSIEEQADRVYEAVRPLIGELRWHADAIETLLPAELYPFPRYADLLFQSK
jgi:glutamine synthetase